MYESDYILNEARKLAQLLARLMGLKTEGKFDEYNALFADTLQRQYDTDLDSLLQLSEDDFEIQIKQSVYSAEKLNALGQLLYVFVEPFDADEQTELLLKKVLIVFDQLEQKHHFQSFENIDKRTIIYRYFNTSYERT